MGFGRDTLGQGQFHGAQHCLFIMMQNQRQDIDHLTIATGAAQHLLLQLPEGQRQFDKRRPIAQCSRLALEDRQIVPPVIDGVRRQVMRALDQPLMLTQDLPLASNYQTVGIDPQAEGRFANDAGTL